MKERKKNNAFAAKFCFRIIIIKTKNKQKTQTDLTETYPREQ